MTTPEATTAVALMRRFAEATGVDSAAPPERYLWTDAFAVCNLLGLHRSGDAPEGLPTALALIDQVHHVLGRHRSDDDRRGWISGLDDDAGEARPTAGGLRVGKPLPERGPGERADPWREWDQDGQYFHYLTRWMHALDQAAWATDDATFNCWAMELAVTAFQAFSYLPAPGQPRRLYWKMSIDLSRPQVSSMGHHDPLDGYLTCLELSTSARALQPGTSAADGGTDLAAATKGLAAMVEHGTWATDDPLGLGGLMADAYRLCQLEARGADVDGELLPAVLRDTRAGLAALLAGQPWRAGAERRLAFRELGLAIGLQALERLEVRLSVNDTRPVADKRNLHDLQDSLAAAEGLAHRLKTFWLDAGNQRASTWLEHRHINEVMLATALAPAGYLELGA